MLDMADAELKSLRKNYNMERAPIELQEKVKVAVTMRFGRSFGSFCRTNKEVVQYVIQLRLLLSWT